MAANNNIDTNINMADCGEMLTLDPVYKYLFWRGAPISTIQQTVNYLLQSFPEFSEEEAEDKVIFWIENYADLKELYDMES